MKVTSKKTSQKLKEFVLDKNYRPILVGDILKVFHFVGARRKKYYMYKQVVGFQPYHPNKFYQVSHLNMKNMNERDSNYPIRLSGERLEDIEIVQGAFGDHEDREKMKPLEDNIIKLGE